MGYVFGVKMQNVLFSVGPAQKGSRGCWNSSHSQTIIWALDIIPNDKPGFPSHFIRIVLKLGIKGERTQSLKEVFVTVLVEALHRNPT